MLVARKRRGSFFTLDCYGDDFRIETSSSDRAGGAVLRHERKFVLLVARDFVLFGEDFGGFSHHHLGQRAEESIAIHAVNEFLVAEAISPARSVEIIRKARHGLSTAGKNATRLPEKDRL